MIESGNESPMLRMTFLLGKSKLQPMHRLGGVCIALLVVIGLQAPSISVAEEPVIEAERLAYCGLGWQTVIYASGFAHQHVTDTCRAVDRSQLIRLKGDQIEAIEKAITNARFCDLPERIKKPEKNTVSTEHFDWLDITVRLKGTMCRTGAGTDDLEETADRAVAGRFSQVWSAIVAVVPEPTE